MPFLYEGNKVAVRPSEIIPKWFSSDEVLSVTLSRHKKLAYGLRKLSGGGRGRELLIDFDSLDIEIRQELGDPRKVKNWMDHFYESDKEAAAFYSSYRFEDGSGLRFEHIEKYTVNASTLNACKLLWVARERERMNKGGSKTGIGTSIWQDCMNFGALQLSKYEVVHSLPENERRFLETYKKYVSEGYEVLISKKHRTANALKVTADVIDLLNRLFAGTKTKPSPTVVAKQYLLFLSGQKEVIDNETGEVFTPKDYPELAQSTIMAYLAKWEFQIGTHLHRAGDRQKYLNGFRIPHSMNRPNYAGSLLSIDDRNPPFVMADGKRVWFYCGIDLCSEVWTVYVHGKTKEGIIVDFYRQLVRNYTEMGIGIPLELECEASLNAGLVKTGLLRDGTLFKKVRIEANNAVGKKIERYFKEQRYGAEKEMIGWRSRPWAKLEANQALTEKEIVLPYTTIVEQTCKAMEAWNNAEHPKHKGKTRLQVHKEMQNPDCSAVAWELVLPKLGYKTKTSCSRGLVQVNRQSFCLAQKGEIALGERLINLMKFVEGEELVVYWLDDNNGAVMKAFAYDKDDNMLCELIAKPVYNRATFERTEVDEANRAMMSAYANTVATFGTKVKQSIRPITLMDVVAKKDEEIEEIEAVEVFDDLEDDNEFFNELPVKRKSLLDTF